MMVDLSTYRGMQMQWYKIGNFFYCFAVFEGNGANERFNAYNRDMETKGFKHFGWSPLTGEGQTVVVYRKQIKAVGGAEVMRINDIPS